VRFATYVIDSTTRIVRNLASTVGQDACTAGTHIDYFAQTAPQFLRALVACVHMPHKGEDPGAEERFITQL
jgi:hypothetical protein